MNNSYKLNIITINIEVINSLKKQYWRNHKKEKLITCSYLSCLMSLFKKNKLPCLNIRKTILINIYVLL